MRLALLAMAVNAAAFLVPDHAWLASQAAANISDERAVAGFPEEALRRAGLTLAEAQAQGLVVPCHVGPFDGNAVSDAGQPGDDPGDRPEPLPQAAHACDVCFLSAAVALTPSRPGVPYPLDRAETTDTIQDSAPLYGISIWSPSGRDPPHALIRI